VVVVEVPSYFYAVAQVYENWYDVPDEEVLEIMDRWERERPGG
jgi:predicted phosphoribosyltransferase